MDTNESSVVTETPFNDPMQPAEPVFSTEADGTPSDTEVAVQQPKRFQTTVWERVFAWLMLPLAFCYASFLMEIINEPAAKIWLSVFVLGFMAFGEILHFKEKITFESVLWFVSEIAILCSFVFGLSSAWKEFHLVLFLHLFAGYWLLTRGKRLAEEKTSHMFLWDGITAFFVLPFKSIPLQVRAMISTFVMIPRKQKEKSAGVKAVIIIVSVIAGIALLAIAVSLLRDADEEFGDIMHKIFDFLRIEWDEDLVIKLILTFMISPYVYGMLAGSFHESKQHFYQRGNNIKNFLEKIRKVPPVVWCIFIGIFTAFYVVFFVLQGKHFFSVFSLTLPESESYSGYARQGFGEMCGVMVVNFLLLWLATRTSSKRSPVLTVACSLLLTESILFALISFMKIFMYIRAFGFTPLRLESIWLSSVLLFACIAWIVSLLSGKKTARVWFIGSAVTLVALAFV